MADPDIARPDPDVVLARVRGEESPRGRLRIFFGYAAGVGKTYSMLQAARRLAADGRDVVVGHVEPHGRFETEVLLEGLELLPKREDDYRGIMLSEFDLDGALARRPETLLLDELAHTNAPWCRYRWRHQDVLELLDAGIDVFTTLNVQHLESLNDVVAGITGITVHETVPDSLFDEAATIDLVDIPPEELTDRFRDGKVYLPDQAARAVRAFFRPENLIALREIALRRAAERVNRDVQSSRLAVAAHRVWRTRELILVCVSPSATSSTLIRRARRMAAASGAPWIACHVNTGGGFRAPGDRERLGRHLALAERLGAEVQTISGESPAQAILAYALQRNVTRIVIGKNQDGPLRRLLRRGLAEQLIRDSGDIDVYVIRGTGDESPPSRRGAARRRKLSWAALGVTVAALAAATCVAEIFRMAGFSEPNLIMSYVLEVFVVALFLGWLPGVIASVGSVLAFNFFFTSPYFTFTVDNAGYVTTFVIMLAVTLVTSSLVQRVRRQVELARRRGARAEALYRLSRSLTGEGGALSVRLAAERHLSAMLGEQVLVVRRPEEMTGDREAAAVQWVIEHGAPAGAGTNTLSGVGSLLLPLPGSDSTLGVLVVPARQAAEATLPDQRQLLEAAAALVGVVIEREELAEKARRVIREAERERSQNALLRSISHDLRTPLATIAGAAEALRRGGVDPATADELVASIAQEAQWLAQLVEKLLQLSRLDSGAAAVGWSRETVDDIVSAAISHIDRGRLAGRLAVSLPEEVVTIESDPTLLQQLVINLVDNALKYSDLGTPVELAASRRETEVELEVRDRGWGFSEQDLPHLFERFFRGARAASVRGTGLGLAICRAVVRAHHGEIDIAGRPGGGSVVRVVLPTRRIDGGEEPGKGAAAPRSRD